MAQSPGSFTGIADIDSALKRVEDIEKAYDPTTVPLENFKQPYQEVKSLLWARNNPVYGAALGEWERKERLFSARVERREKSSADLINQIFNLVGFFSGFQGLVLTAVTQLSASSCKSQCRKVWFPILLTVVAAIVTIVGVVLRFRALKDLEDSIKTEKRAQAVRNHMPLFHGFDNFYFQRVVCMRGLIERILHLETSRAALKALYVIDSVECG